VHEKQIPTSETSSHIAAGYHVLYRQQCDHSEVLCQTFTAIIFVSVTET